MSDPLLVDRHLCYLFTSMNDIVSKITYNHEFNLFSGKETRCKYTILSIRYDIFLSIKVSFIL